MIVNTRVNIHETNNYGKTNVTGMSNPSAEWFLKTLHRERQQKKKKQPMQKLPMRKFYVEIIMKCRWILLLLLLLLLL